MKMLIYYIPVPGTDQTGPLCPNGGSAIILSIYQVRRTTYYYNNVRCSNWTKVTTQYTKTDGDRASIVGCDSSWSKRWKPKWNRPANVFWWSMYRGPYLRSTLFLPCAVTCMEKNKTQFHSPWVANGALITNEDSRFWLFFSRMVPSRSVFR